MHRGVIGSGPQEFLPEDRAWGRVILGHFQHGYLRLNDPEVLGVAAAELGHRATASIGYPQHRLSGAANVIEMQPTPRARFRRR